MYFFRLEILYYSTLKGKEKTGEIKQTVTCTHKNYMYLCIYVHMYIRLPRLPPMAGNVLICPLYISLASGVFNPRVSIYSSTMYQPRSVHCVHTIYTVKAYVNSRKVKMKQAYKKKLGIKEEEIRSRPPHHIVGYLHVSIKKLRGLLIPMRYEKTNTKSYPYSVILGLDVCQPWRCWHIEHAHRARNRHR